MVGNGEKEAITRGVVMLMHLLLPGMGPAHFLTGSTRSFCVKGGWAGGSVGEGAKVRCFFLSLLFSLATFYSPSS